MRAQKCLGFGVAGTGGPARADGREIAGVLIGAAAIEVLRGQSERRKKNEGKEEPAPPGGKRSCL